MATQDAFDHLQRADVGLRLVFCTERMDARQRSILPVMVLSDEELD